MVGQEGNLFRFTLGHSVAMPPVHLRADLASGRSVALDAALTMTGSPPQTRAPRVPFRPSALLPGQSRIPAAFLSSAHSARRTLFFCE